MKKYFLAVILFTGACAPIPHYSLTKVSWTQEGKNCVYQENYGDMREEWNIEKFKYEKKEYISSVRTIKYGNTPCEKIIDAELKNKTNKSAMPNNFYDIKNISNTNVSF